MRRRWSVVVTALVTTLALALTLAGCSSDDPSTTPIGRATPIAKLDVSTLHLARAEFCDRVPVAAVRRALGGSVESDDGWGNGDPVAGDSGTGDLGHEIGCAWNGDGGAAARAWVFARPVTAAFAATLDRQAGRRTGCTATPTKVFGSPSVLQSCTLPGGVRRLRRAGLFADTWVTCEVSGSGKGLRVRTDAWCATVIAALDTSSG